MAEENVKVAVRVRPFNQREKDAKSKLIVQMAGNQTVIFHPQTNEEKNTHMIIPIGKVLKIHLFIKPLNIFQSNLGVTMASKQNLMVIFRLTNQIMLTK